MKTEQFIKLMNAIRNGRENLINGFGESVYQEYHFWMLNNASKIDLEYYINKFGEDYKALAEDLMGFFLMSMGEEDYTLEGYYEGQEN